MRSIEESYGHERHSGGTEQHEPVRAASSIQVSRQDQNTAALFSRMRSAVGWNGRNLNFTACFLFVAILPCQRAKLSASTPAAQIYASFEWADGGAGRRLIRKGPVAGNVDVVLDKRSHVCCSPRPVATPPPTRHQI